MTEIDSSEVQAQRLEGVATRLGSWLRQPEVAQRLRHAPGEDAWSALQTMGHLVEMIPYWLNHCQRLIAATGEPPAFGRTLGAPERLAGVEQGAIGEPDVLLRQLEEQVQTAARAIRDMTMAERSKIGIHLREGEMTVAEVIERFIVSHAEEHCAQVQAAIRS